MRPRAAIILLALALVGTAGCLLTAPIKWAVKGMIMEESLKHADKSNEELEKFKNDLPGMVGMELGKKIGDFIGEHWEKGALFSLLSGWGAKKGIDRKLNGNARPPKGE